jgi:hypothetical protein
MANFNPAPKPVNTKKYVVFKPVTNSVWSRQGNIFTCDVSSLQTSPQEAFEFGGSLTLNLPMTGLAKFNLFVPQLDGLDSDSEIRSWKFVTNDFTYIIYND